MSYALIRLDPLEILEEWPRVKRPVVLPDGKHWNTEEIGTSDGEFMLVKVDCSGAAPDEYQHRTGWGDPIREGGSVRIPPIFSEVSPQERAEIDLRKVNTEMARTDRVVVSVIDEIVGVLNKSALFSSTHFSTETNTLLARRAALKRQMR